MIGYFAFAFRDPFCFLYLVQATTYVGAAVAVRRDQHALWLCYLVSAAVHAGAAALHASQNL
jgi:hypothetical protein